ncbi:MAG: hypothetical protein QOG84_993 [Sphingomonadales bacterium]|jgi:hypothetical protein|nr:hypothetical protein [Sphingomonadales bacterium]
MWRGQADIQWPVHSAAYRRLAKDSRVPKDQDLISYEKRLLRRATHRGYRIFEGRELSDFELLARLQHHGAATRLLDATRSSLVGLFFACERLPTKTGVLLGFHAYTMGGYEGQPLEKAYDAVVEALPKYEHPQTWEPSNVSPRIAAQHSQLLYSAVSPDPRGSLWIGDDKKYPLVAVAISPAMKRICLKTLSESFDIRELTLFPDLYGFAASNDVLHGEYDDARW